MTGMAVFTLLDKKALAAHYKLNFPEFNSQSTGGFACLLTGWSKKQATSEGLGVLINQVNGRFGAND
jgi:hypothetical protein